MEEHNQQSTPNVLDNQQVQAQSSAISESSSKQVDTNSQANSAPSQSVGVVDNTEKAGFIVRAGANILDSFLIILPSVVILAIIPNVDEDITKSLIGLVFLIYMTLATGLYGTTLGKKFFHLRVISVDGKKVGLGKALVRETLGKIISSVILNLGFLWIIWDKKKQGWHDKLGKSVVIKVSK